jgi:hypothetical protein
MAQRQHRARRVALLAPAVTAAAIALSGCHEILRVTLGRPDPPVHNPTSAGRRAAPAAGIAASAGRPFTGKAKGKLAGRIVLRHGFVKSTMKNALFAGTLTGTLPGPARAGDELLGPFVSSRWNGRFTVVRDRRNGKIDLTGLVLATSGDQAGRSCLKLSYRNLRKGKRAKSRNRGTGTLRIVGGEGTAKTLTGTARVNVRLLVRSETLRLSGRVKAAQGAPRRLPPACAKLERQVGLAPIPG